MPIDLEQMTSYNTEFQLLNQHTICLSVVFFFDLKYFINSFDIYEFGRCRLYVDPVLSLIMAVLITSTAWPLLKQSALILLQSVPTHIQVNLKFEVF